MSRSLRLVSSKTSPRMSKTRPLRASLSICELLEQAVVDVALAGLLGDEVPEVADLGLADAVDAAEPLFEAVRVPRQVVVDHQVGVLEVHALAGGVGGDEHADVGVGAEQRLRACGVRRGACRRGW